MPSLNDNALTNVADVKESLGYTSGDHSKDNLIARKINQASQQIENYCGRVFRDLDYTELYNGSQIDEMVLNQRPVNSLTLVEYRATAINTDNWITLSDKYYYVDESAGILKLLFNSAGRWDRWRITYNAGYTTIPSDLAEACVSLVCFYVINADGSDVGVMEKTEGQRRLKYSNTNQTFKTIIEQLGINQIIDGYANWPLRSE